jgi:hypothetical protein
VIGDGVEEADLALVQLTVPVVVEEALLATAGPQQAPGSILLGVRARARDERAEEAPRLLWIVPLDPTAAVERLGVVFDPAVQLAGVEHAEELLRRRDGTAQVGELLRAVASMVIGMAGRGGAREPDGHADREQSYGGLHAWILLAFRVAVRARTS